MNQTKRRMLKGTVGLLAGGVALPWHLSARAQQYPTKPITMVIPSTPGGAADQMARTVTDAIGKELGQPVILDYKAGAGGQLASAYLVKAAPDGYTLMFTTTAPLFYAPHMTTRLNYDARRDFTYISQVTDGGLMMVANKDMPFSTMHEMVEWVRQRGKGKVTYGSYGIGTVSHLLSAYLSESRNLGMVHAAYKGEAQFITDMIGGHVPLGLASIWTAAPHINAGRLKGICVFGETRHPLIPNVPTLGESGIDDPDFKVVSGNFLIGPANMPPAVLARVEAAIRHAVAEKSIHERFHNLGAVPVGGSAEDARKLFDISQARIARLVKISGATLD